MDKIKIQKNKPIKLAYIEHIGKYDTIPFDKYIPRLFEWAKENKVRPGFKNINVYHDDPNEKTPPWTSTTLPAAGLGIDPLGSLGYPFPGLVPPGAT